MEFLRRHTALLILGVIIALTAIITPSIRRAVCRLKNSISRIVSYNRYVAIKLHNTLTGRIEVFKPIKSGEVRMYHCGPTAYSIQHIGNLSMFVFTDILRRTLEYYNFKVKQVINITDF